MEVIITLDHNFRPHSFFVQWQILMKTSFDVGGLSFLRVNAMALVGPYPMLP